jgi:hypothetical protein
LGADEIATALPTVLAYWRDFSGRYVTALCALPELGEGTAKPPVPLPGDGELDATAAAVPPMTGAEYLTAATLADLWRAMDEAFDTELAVAGLSVQEFLKSRSCPDWADMCKHVAAVLYGLGARLDEKPALLFVLRNVDEEELLAGAGGDLSFAKATPRAKVLDDGDVAALLGLEMAESRAAEKPKAIARARPKPPPAASAPAVKPVAGKTTANKTTANKTVAGKKVASKKAANGKISGRSAAKNGGADGAAGAIRDARLARRAV